MMTPAGNRHGIVCLNIGFELKLYLRQHPVGVAMCNDPGIITQRNPDSVRGGDVVYFSYERLPKGAVPLGFSAIQPEIVFEVKSPSDRWKDLHTKVAEYLQAGVSVVCVVDFETESVIMNYGDEPTTTLTKYDNLTLNNVLPGFSVPVRNFFAD